MTDEGRAVYIEMSSEHLEGIVGPFATREEADLWATEFVGAGRGEWQGATAYSPGRAYIEKERDIELKSGGLKIIQEGWSKL